MENVNNINSQKLYEKKKIRIAVVGLIFGVVASLSALIAAVFVGTGTSLVFMKGQMAFEETPVTILLYSIIMLGIADFCAGIYTTIFCGITKRNPIKEMKRTASLPVSWFMCLGAFVAGPLASSLALASYFMCGMTLGTCIVAFAPLIVSIISKFVFKERLSARVYLGVCILVIGTVAAGIAPVENMPNFIPGIICAFLSATFFALEGILSTYAADMIDEYIGCGFFRCFCSGIMAILFGLTVAVVTGNISFFIEFFANYWIFIPWLAAVAGFLNFAQYNLIYSALVKCGPARCQAMVYTMPIWSIFIGIAGHKIFGDLYTYSYSTQTVIGAVIVVIATIIIVCKPSELVTLRDNS